MPIGDDGKYYARSEMIRIECPMCQNHDPKHIEELDDLKKPLYFFKNGKKPMYAKKYHCTDCRYEWSKL